MSHQFWLPQPARLPAPSELAAYLQREGWSHQESNSHWAIFQKKIQNRPVVIEVPQLFEAIDYPRAVRSLLEDLAQLEGRPAATILGNL